MVLCQENNTQAMFQTRQSPPANYNFGHFPGYVPQNNQYPAPMGHTNDYSQFQVDPSAFQQAQCYMAYGSRPVEEWVNNYGMATSTGTSSPHNYAYRNAHPMGMDYPHSQVSSSQVNQSLTVLGSSPQPICSPTASTSSSGSPGSPSNKQLRPPYDWMKKTSYAPCGAAPGKTRTKDKYRVVYSDHQRLELEKEFHYSRYITIRRKAELAQTLSLSERQVKIWFQNRRAKERKQNKKRDEAVSAISTGSGHGSSDMQIHNEATKHVTGMSLPVHNQTSLQSVIKSDPMDDFNQIPTQTIQDHKEGLLQSRHSPESVSTSMSVSTSLNMQIAPSTAVSVIKMDPHEIVSQA